MHCALIATPPAPAWPASRLAVSGPSASRIGDTATPMMSSRYHPASIMAPRADRVTQHHEWGPSREARTRSDALRAAERSRAGEAGHGRGARLGKGHGPSLRIRAGVGANERGEGGGDWGPARRRRRREHVAGGPTALLYPHPTRVLPSPALHHPPRPPIPPSVQSAPAPPPPSPARSATHDRTSTARRPSSCVCGAPSFVPSAFRPRLLAITKLWCIGWWRRRRRRRRSGRRRHKRGRAVSSANDADAADDDAAAVRGNHAASSSGRGKRARAETKRERVAAASRMSRLLGVWYQGWRSNGSATGDGRGWGGRAAVSSCACDMGALRVRDRGSDGHRWIRWEGRPVSIEEGRGRDVNGWVDERPNKSADRHMVLSRSSFKFTLVASFGFPCFWAPDFLTHPGYKFTQ
ncbi:hypothetical protein DFH09DRAFT_1463124 [Mycena vulgaris]|nr:hypothetical protein DFH09DRAFT_1463124 [Mycena vulgaris]